jgi:outer membrane protein
MSKTIPSPAPKWIIYFSLGASVVALIASILFFFKKENIVYVDSLKLLSQYKGTIAARAEYEKKTLVWKANIDTLTTELNDQINQYQKDKPKLSAREKKLTEDLIGSKQQQLENYKGAISENATKEDQAITSQVFKEISDFLKKYGENHGYDYILGATNIGNVMYARNGKNITEDILKELNAGFQPVKK